MGDYVFIIFGLCQIKKEEFLRRFNVPLDIVQLKQKRDQ